MLETTEKLAKNQVVFREVNEQIAHLTGLADGNDYRLVICECSDVYCAEAIELTAAEYEHARADGTHFLVCPGHQLPQVEHVIAETGRYLIVEKFGPAAQIAAADNPR